MKILKSFFPVNARAPPWGALPGANSDRDGAPENGVVAPFPVATPLI